MTFLCTLMLLLTFKTTFLRWISQRKHASISSCSILPHPRWNCHFVLLSQGAAGLEASCEATLQWLSILQTRYRITPAIFFSIAYMHFNKIAIQINLVLIPLTFYNCCSATASSTGFLSLTCFFFLFVHGGCRLGRFLVAISPKRTYSVLSVQLYVITVATYGARRLEGDKSTPRPVEASYLMHLFF